MNKDFTRPPPPTSLLPNMPKGPSSFVMPQLVSWNFGAYVSVSKRCPITERAPGNSTKLSTQGELVH